MNETEQLAVLRVGLLAAYADGLQNEPERAALRRVAESLGLTAADIAALTPAAVMGRTPLESVVGDLRSPTARAVAYEMAVAVCDADGPATPAEAAFLQKLRLALALDAAPAAAAEADAFAREADAAAASTGAIPPAGATAGDGRPPLGAERPRASASTGAGAPPPPPPPVGTASTMPSGEPRRAVPTVPEAELDALALRYAIITAALELLPQNVATFAVLPAQMRLVYKIGEAYGYQLDRGHIKDFLATAGVGLAAQAVEGMARRLLQRAAGSLLGGLGGALVGGLGGQAASSGLTFATTYALGMVAKQYYAGGRKLSAIQLREVFQDCLGKGRDLYSRHAGQVQQEARRVAQQGIPRDV